MGQNGVAWFLYATLTQAWFPMHAEVWNAPTWLLSGLALATSLLPFALPKVAKMDKKALRRMAIWLTIINVLPKIGYLYDFDCFALSEGWTAPKAFPNLAVFNILRFSPVMIASEVLLGAVACRLVMLDGASDDEAKPVSTMSRLLYNRKYTRPLGADAH
jgi:peptidoglycan/LPS O-acetylase OafA/YrhL